MAQAGQSWVKPTTFLPTSRQEKNDRKKKWKIKSKDAIIIGHKSSLFLSRLLFYHTFYALWLKKNKIFSQHYSVNWKTAHCKKKYDAVNWKMQKSHDTYLAINWKDKKGKFFTRSRNHPGYGRSGADSLQYTKRALQLTARSRNTNNASIKVTGAIFHVFGLATLNLSSYYYYSHLFLLLFPFPFFFL